MLTPGPDSFALGTWRFTKKHYDDFAECLAIAREFGVTHIDTADVYGGKDGFGGVEILLGQLRDEAPDLFENTTMATKIGIEFGSPYNQSPAYLRDAMQATLDRLRMDHVDLLYIHRPDNLAHPGDVAEVLDGFVSDGLARQVGVSNFTPWQVMALRQYLQAELYAHQTELSVLYTKRIFDGTLDEAMMHRTRVAAWSPLGGGQLFAEKEMLNPAIHDLRETIEDMAKAHKTDVTAIAYAFIRQHPSGAVPIIGTTNPRRLRSMLETEPVTLSRPEWYRLLEANIGHRMP